MPCKDSRTKPAIYHCISRVVGRGFVLAGDECEQFRMLMRMCEKFTGCRVLSYCLMSNQQAQRRAEEIRSRYTRRMHDLSEFMKSLLERFTKWFNRRHTRSGTLWEDRFKSVIVESGVAARTMAAYIDQNPVRAGMAEDPADYRWSSYGEAVGGRVKGDSLTRSGVMGNGKKAREGLVRAYYCDQGVGYHSS